MKRFRRTKVDLNNNLISSAKELIEEVGFNNVTVMGIAEKANIQASVFYNRYKDLDDLFDKLVREYDYFLNDSVKINPEARISQNYPGLLNELAESLLEDKIMQRLLVWELSNDNYITRRTSASRELNGRYLMDYFSREFKDSSININALTALIIGGIYYLILHRKSSTLCGIDFSKKDGIALLKETIECLSKKIFNRSNSESSQEDKNISEMIRVAGSLLKNNVDINIIKESTGLSEEVLSSLARGTYKSKDAEEDEELPAPVIIKRRGRKKKTA